MSKVVASFQDVESRFKKVATEDAILVAVSKKQSIDKIETVFNLGHRDFGENYVQELLQKKDELEKRGCTGARWHFIGGLQRNKVKQILPHVYEIHSVDSAKLAGEIHKRSEELQIEQVRIFLQVNIDREVSKGGVDPDEVPGVLEELNQLSRLRLQGLMCIPSFERDSRPAFEQMVELNNSTRELTQGILSMGMTSDFEIAAKLGSGRVRVGTAIFGQRS